VEWRPLFSAGESRIGDHPNTLRGGGI